MYVCKERSQKCLLWFVVVDGSIDYIHNSYIVITYFYSITQYLTHYKVE